MWNSDEMLILSDIHLAPERGQVLFQADAELVACLSSMLSEAKNCTIVPATHVLSYLVRGVNERTEGTSLTRGIKYIKYKLIETLKHVSALNEFFDVGASDEFSLDLPLLIEHGANLVVCGHTHAAKAYLKHLLEKKLTRATLFEWKEMRPEILPAWIFSSQARSWQQEA